MSYNNELYIFSEVPGYDASKGERTYQIYWNFEFLTDLSVLFFSASVIKV